jgi:hypothetical protein
MDSRFKRIVIIASLYAAGLYPAYSPGLPAFAAARQQSPQNPQGLKDFEQRALAADQAFVDAASKSDMAALDKMLDARFTWTDANGKTLTRQEFLREAPKPAISDAGGQGGATVPGDSQPAAPIGARDLPNLTSLETFHNYGSLEVIHVHKEKDQALHIWVNRSTGWRMLLYQEVRLLEAPPPPSPGTRAACENPCKTMPFEPKTPNERDVIAGFMALQTYTVAHDAKNWGVYVADEFEAANSNSDQTLNKRGRMADLARSKMAGYTPMPVVDMRVLDFGTAAILISNHQPPNAKPVHITRVWVKRGGHWMEAASYQTRIEEAAGR